MVANGIGILPTQNLLQVFLFTIFLLATSLISSLEESREERGNIENMVEDVYSIIEDSSIKPRTYLVRLPESADEYDRLWGGFQREYFAYNPGYHVEENTVLVDQDTQMIEEVYVPRYKDSKFHHAYYLFLTGDNDGKGDFERFTKLMRATEEKCPEVVGKLSVKKIEDKPAARESEYYFGTKEEVKTTIIEPSQFPLRRSHGKPYYYLVTEHQDIYERIKHFFDEHWESEKAKSVNIFEAKSV